MLPVPTSLPLKVGFPVRLEQSASSFGRRCCLLRVEGSADRGSDIAGSEVEGLAGIQLGQRYLLGVYCPAVLVNCHDPTEDCESGEHRKGGDQPA